MFKWLWDISVGILRIVSGIKNVIDPPDIPEYVAAPANAIEELSTEKKNLTPNGEIIIGLRDPTLTINATGNLTSYTDFTTYGDRAIVKLTNETGSSIDLTGLCIKGKPVMQLSGQNGYVWEYSDYDAIEKEGEQSIVFSNDFIFDPVQAKQIGDFVWKELKPHKLYSLMLIGCQYQYEIGDVYHLTLTHTMNGGTMEDIDTDVEVMGVSINRSVGGVGMTNLNLRVPSEAWALTLAKNSKLVGAGNAQRLNNRSNVVTVASSTWTGQADYFCDGTDDNVEIQAAIDYLFSVGGGIARLTKGSFSCNNSILIIKSGVSLTGDDYSTSLYNCAIRWDSASVINASVSNFSMSSPLTAFAYIVDGYDVGEVYNISVTDTSPDDVTGTNINIFYRMAKISFCNVTNCGGGTIGPSYKEARCFAYCKLVSGCSVSKSPTGIIGFLYCTDVSLCSFHDVVVTSGSGIATGFYECDNITTSSSYNSSSDGASAQIRSFYRCRKVVACSSYGNSTVGGNTYGFYICKSVQQCKSIDNTSNYNTSYADSGTANACADTAAGGYNS